MFYRTTTCIFAIAFCTRRANPSCAMKIRLCEEIEGNSANSFSRALSNGINFSCSRDTRESREEKSEREMDIGTSNDPRSNSGSDSADYRFADRQETRAPRAHVALRLVAATLYVKLRISTSNPRKGGCRRPGMLQDNPIS